MSLVVRGFDVIWDHLRMEDVECYWKHVLTGYAGLIKWTVTPDNSLININ